MTGRRTWLLAGVGGAAVLAGVGGALWRETRNDEVDATFWAQRFSRPEGGELELSAYLGRPLVLNFWATWCPPCVREMPLLDRFQREHAASGWQVVGLAVDGPTPVRAFLQRNPVSFPIGLAGLAGTQLTRSLGNHSGGLPFTVVFDAHGRVRERHLGEATMDDMRRWVALS